MSKIDISRKSKFARCKFYNPSNENSLEEKEKSKKQDLT